MEVKVLLIQNSKMHHPSKVRMKVKKDAIESILRNHGYDPMTHCEIPEQKGKRTKKSMRNKTWSSVSNSN